MMWDSLKRLRELPEDTLLYCGHEYTLANATVRDHRRARQPGAPGALAEVEELRSRDEPTLPTTMAAEKATNPFLRADDAGPDEGGRHAERRPGGGVRRNPHAEGQVLGRLPASRRTNHSPSS